MAIDLVTGQPGHGKTAYAIDKAFQAQKEGREVYAHGIKDFDYDKAKFKYLDDPTKWQELPDGAYILLDECYTSFPNRNPGSKVPEHVEALARHRHRGFDFMLVCQQGLQLDPFIRGLVETHTHVRQTSVFKKKTKLKRWTQYQNNTQGQCMDVEDWIRPTYVFDYYTSTTKITTKRSMPMWMRWLLIGFGILFVIAAGMKWWFDSKIAQYSSEASPTASAAAAPGTRGAHVPGVDAAARTYATPTEYAVAHLPRLALTPWSAPIYDGQAPTRQPEWLCMSSTPSDDDPREPSCTCLTEQGTKVEISQPECRSIARNGPQYNPYKQVAAPQVATVAPVQPVIDPVASPGAVVGHTAGSRADPFPRSEGYRPDTWTGPTKGL